MAEELVEKGKSRGMTAPMLETVSCPFEKEQRLSLAERSWAEGQVSLPRHRENRFERISRNSARSIEATSNHRITRHLGSRFACILRKREIYSLGYLARVSQPVSHEAQSGFESVFISREELTCSIMPARQRAAYAPRENPKTKILSPA